jgi:hypothetical protein
MTCNCFRADRDCAKCNIDNRCAYQLPENFPDTIAALTKKFVDDVASLIANVQPMPADIFTGPTKKE